MRIHLSLIPAVVLLTAANAPQGDAGKKDMEKLQGTWRVVSMEGEGEKAPADFAKRFTYTFKGDRIHFLGDKTTPGADLEFSYTLDAAKQPKAIDMKITKSPDKKDVGEGSVGIYVLDGDNLKLCMDPKERPKDFTTKQGQARTLVVLKREKK
jgi:uncharacterized protein (TIGR03067 family)